MDGVREGVCARVCVWMLCEGVCVDVVCEGVYM